MTEANKRRPAAPADDHRTDLILVGALTLLSLAVMTAYSLSSHPELHPDFERYVGVAQGIASFDLHRAFHFHYPPLYPLMLALLEPILGSYETAARVVNVVTTALAVIPMYFLALILFGRRAAVLTGLFFALRFFDKYSIVKAEQPAILLIYLGILLGFLGLRRGGWKYHLAAGVSFGLGFLTKAEAGAYFFGFFGLGLIETAWMAAVTKPTKAPPPAEKPKEKNFAPAPEKALASHLRPRLISLAAAVGGYFLIVSPYLISYTAATGKISLSPKNATLFKLHNYLGGHLYTVHHDQTGYYTPAQRIYIDGDRMPIDLSGVRKPGLVKFVGAYFKRLGRNLKTNLTGKYLQIMAPWLWAPLLLLGLWPHGSDGRWRHELFLTVLGLIPVFSVPLFSSSYERFFFTIAPWMTLVLANGVNRALELTLDRAKWEKKATAEKAVVGAIGALLLAFAVALIVHPETPGKPVNLGVEFRRQFGAMVKVRLEGDCRFMAELDLPSLWYLAGLPMDRMELLPISNLNGLVALAKDRKAKYLFLHRSRFIRRYRTLNPLLDPGFSSPDLRLIYRSVGPDGDPNVLYEIVPVKCGN